MPSMVGPSCLAALLNVLCLVPSLRCFLRIAAGCQSCYCASQLDLLLTFIISSEPVSEPISLQVLPRAVSCTACHSTACSYFATVKECDGTPKLLLRFTTWPLVTDYYCGTALDDYAKSINYRNQNQVFNLLRNTK